MIPRIDTLKSYANPNSIVHSRGREVINSIGQGGMERAPANIAAILERSSHLRAPTEPAARRLVLKASRTHDFPTTVSLATVSYLDATAGLVLGAGFAWGDDQFWKRHPTAASPGRDCAALEVGTVCFDKLKESYYVKAPKRLSDPRECAASPCTFFTEWKHTSRWTRPDLSELPFFDWAGLIHPGVEGYLPSDAHVTTNRLANRTHPHPATMYLAFKQIVWRVEGAFALIVPTAELYYFNTTANVSIDIPLVDTKDYQEGLMGLVEIQ